MTRIDFYILPENAADRFLFTCRLADKIYNKGHRLYIHTESQDHAVQLDELLWTFSQGNFLPHGICHTCLDADLPIHIGYHAEPPMSDADVGGVNVLINLSSAVPLFFSRFARVAEIVGGDADVRQSARERFRFYRDRGYTLESHTI
ncbi:MAG: DNA polymerase III subunit chi [Pseudomonadota bacterium]